MLPGQNPSNSSQSTPTSPLHILFIGNSLTFSNLGVYYHLKKLAESSSPAISVEESHVVVPGATLLVLWANSKAAEEIRSGRYDVVVLQETLPFTTAQDFRQSCNKFVSEIRNVHAKTVLFMAWSFQKVPNYSTTSTDDIAKAHYAVAKALNIEVAPVALAWQQIAVQRPELRLYSGDNIHPVDAGTYVAACVCYCTIFNRSPVGNPYIGFVRQDIAEYLQQVAWQTYNNQPK